MVHAIFVLLVPMVLLLELARSVRLGLSVTLLVHFSVTSAPEERPRLKLDYRSAPFVLSVPTVPKVLTTKALSATAVRLGRSVTRPERSDVTSAPEERPRLKLDYRSAPFVLSVPTVSKVLTTKALSATAVHLAFLVTRPERSSVTDAPLDRPRLLLDLHLAIQYPLHGLPHLHQVCPHSHLQ